jgi:SAM-dependent methyltransferase
VDLIQVAARENGMSSIEQNRRFYDHYKWSRKGDEWAGDWMTSEMQWFGTLLPRIARYLPASTIVQIGPGYGRWSGFLRAHCERLVLLDISPNCVDECEQRFGADSDVQVYLTDGVTIPVEEENSVEFVFSFFSLVHADLETMTCYLREIRRVLSPYGVAFLHHSNMGDQTEPPPDLSPSLADEFRDMSVSARAVDKIVSDLDLCCPVQETFSWDGRPELSDCFSVVTWPNSNLNRKHRKFANSNFVHEKNYLGDLEKHYGGLILKPSKS